VNFLKKHPGFFIFLFFSILFSAQIFPGIYADSLTADEPSDITNGYYYLTRGDVVTPHNHPPLGSALQALPLLFMHLKTAPFTGDVIDRAHFFIFDWNLGQLASVTLWTRFVSWGMGLGIGFLLFRAAKRDKVLLTATLLLWAFNPTLLALSGLAKTDITPSFFFFLALWFFQKSQGKFSVKTSITAGISAGCAIVSKFYCLALIPLFVILEFLDPGKIFSRKKMRRGQAAETRNRWLLGLAGLAGVVFILYLPATLLLPDHRAPFTYLIEKFKEDLAYAHQSHPVYFWGQSGLESHWYYFPAAFLLKEPLPFLILLAAGGWLFLRREIFFPPWVWITPLFFSLVLLPAPNLGVRYLLPAYPFLFLAAAEAAAWIWKKRSQLRWMGVLAITLGLWQVASLLAHFSHAISYFNELIPPDHKIHYLADSNLDWGQDLKRLAAAAKEKKWGKVKLAYLGAVDPKVYGLDWEPWREKDLKSPQPGIVYAVNAGFLQLAPAAYPSTKVIAESWISQRPISGKVGECWYYFEIPGRKEPEVEETPYLPSVPFLQYRGYANYPILLRASPRISPLG
jgi:hypothetical protein